MDGPAVTCAQCGRVADPLAEGDPPLTWTADTDAAGTRWVCPACTRLHLRAIEGRLDPDWW